MEIMTNYDDTLCTEQCIEQDNCMKTCMNTMNIPQPLFGLDSFNIIHKCMSMLLYPCPSTPKDKFDELAKNPNVKLFFITNKQAQIKTCICEIYPEIKSLEKSSKIDKKNVIIFAHGNGCDIYTFYSYLQTLANELGIRVISWDYPQYGLSQGHLNEHTCYVGIKDIIEHYEKKNKKILLVGQSLGTGIVIDYVSKHYWNKPIILISPYKSIPKIISNYDWIENLICKNKFASHLKISKCVCPIKIFHGQSDRLIDISHAKELYELVQNNKFEPTWYANVGHNDILDVITMSDYKNVLSFL